MEEQMKKILPVLLTVALMLGACASKSSSEPVDGTTATEAAKETKKETTEETTAEAASRNIDVTYVGDGKLPIVEVGGKRYFDFTADDFLKKLNAKSKEIMNEPSTFKLSAQETEGNQVMIESDKELICLLEMDSDHERIAQVYVMGVQSDDFKLSNLAVEATPILMVLDPNMESKYAGMHLVDIALAAQISFSQSQYAYEGVHEGIRERIYGEEDFIIFNFAPALDSADEDAAAEAVARTGAKVDFGSLSDDLYSFQIQVNEDVYQFPMSYADFITFGWQYDGDETKNLSSNTYGSSEVFKNGKLKCYAGIANFDVNTRPISECHVISIKFDAYMVKESDVTITLPGGITFGGSMDEAVALYGTPYYEYDNGTSRRTVTYQLASQQEVKISSEFEKMDIIGDIEVRNIVKPDDFVAGDISDEVPAIVGKYKAPSKLSDNFGDFIVEYGGDLYQLPAPVSVFVSNGWKILEDASQTSISGKDSSWVTLMKDNQKLKVIAKNYDENAVGIANGFVTDTVSDVNGNKTPILIAKNITVGMSRKDLESALAGVAFETDQSTSFDYYNIYPTGSKVDSYSISVSKESDTVSRISVKYAPSVSEYVNR